MEHGHSLVIPRHFDGNNYTYLKIRMKSFLKTAGKDQPLVLGNGQLPKKK